MTCDNSPETTHTHTVGHIHFMDYGGENIVWVGNEITITALMRYVNETELLVRLS